MKILSFLKSGKWVLWLINGNNTLFEIRLFLLILNKPLFYFKESLKKYTKAISLIN